MTVHRGLARQPDPKIVAQFFDRERRRERELAILRELAKRDNARWWAAYLRRGAAGH